MTDEQKLALPAPEAPAKAAPQVAGGEAEAGLEEALRLCEIGEYLYNTKAYSYGDGYTEPREYGIDWQWQQSKPNEYGQGVLLAEAAKWHDEQADEGTPTEATKLRRALAHPAPSPAARGAGVSQSIITEAVSIAMRPPVAMTKDEAEAWCAPLEYFADVLKDALEPAVDISPDDAPSAVFEAVRKAFLRGAEWHRQYGDDPLISKAAYDHADAATSAALLPADIPPELAAEAHLTRAGACAIATAAIRTVSGYGTLRPEETGKDDDWRFRARLARSDALSAAVASVMLAFDEPVAPTAAAEELREVLELLVEEFGGSIEQYDKIGPCFTHKDGTEVFDVGVLLDRRELIDRARTLLAGAPTANPALPADAKLTALQAERDSLATWQREAVDELMRMNLLSEGLRETRAALYAECDRLRAVIARKDAALRFYADGSKYPAPLTGGMGELWADCGRLASAAIKTEG